MDIEALKKEATELVLDKGTDIVLAIVTLIIGWWVIGMILGVIKKALERGKAEESLANFLSKLAGIGLKILLIISVAAMVGIETTSFIAVLGAAGLAVGLALQGSLSNFAGGVLILLVKPFRVGEVIDSQGHLGTVESIDILHTTLKTFDNKTVILPNGPTANSVVINYTRKDSRRVEIPVGISYDADISEARKIALEVLKKDDRIKDEPAPAVLVSALGDNSVNLSVRVWTHTDNLWPVYWDNIEKIKMAFDDNDITIPYPQRDVHLYQHTPDK